MKYELSKDADTLLCLLYKKYCESRRDGLPISDASYFGDDEAIHRNIAPNWLLEDISDLCWVLNMSGLLDVQPGDDKANDVTITDAGISYLQHRFPKGLSQLLKFISELAAVVAPWI